MRNRGSLKQSDDCAAAASLASHITEHEFKVAEQHAAPRNKTSDS